MPYFMDESNYSIEPVNIDKKRVLFVVTQDEMGGAQKFLFHLLNRLDFKKYEMMLVTGENSGIGLLSDSIKNNIKTIHLPSLIRNISFLEDIKTIFRLRKII